MIYALGIWLVFMAAGFMAACLVAAITGGYALYAAIYSPALIVYVALSVVEARRYLAERR